MGIVAEVLGDHLQEHIRGLEEYCRKQKRSMKKPQTVVRSQQESGFQAWSDVEYYVSHVVKEGVFFWHKGMPAAELRATYRDAASRYAALMGVYDFSTPVAREISVSWCDAHGIEEMKKGLGKDILGVAKRRDGTYLRYLDCYRLDTYAAEAALLCAMIAQDWNLARSLAEHNPIPLQIPRRGYQSFVLLRFALLGDRRAAKYADGFPARLQGVDFPPRRGDLILGIARGDEDILAKSLQGINKTFREKWNIKKYIAPQWLRRHGGSEERLRETIQRDLIAYQWLYSPWTVGLLCFAAHAGMADLYRHPNKFSDFVPHDLCCPA